MVQALNLCICFYILSPQTQYISWRCWPNFINYSFLKLDNRNIAKADSHYLLTLCIILVRYWHCEERKYPCFSKCIKNVHWFLLHLALLGIKIARGERILRFRSWRYFHCENQKFEIDIFSRFSQNAVPRCKIYINRPHCMKKHTREEGSASLSV